MQGEGDPPDSFMIPVDRPGPVPGPVQDDSAGSPETTFLPTFVMTSGGGLRRNRPGRDKTR